MGPSGAGKTTFMNILAGRITEGELSADIRVNNHKRGKFWKSIVGYVEQDDLMHPLLTVKETIDISASLRLPRQIPKGEKDKRVKEVITGLGLIEVQNSKIGDSEHRGVSGGERKRVAVGSELVTNPRLLFLDEPTSGLDAFTAYSLIQTLQQLAQSEKKTIICTIHQPRTDILFLFSKIMLLSAGKVVYFGSVPDSLDYYASLGYRCPALVNPADFFLDNITVDYRTPSATDLSKQKVVIFQEKWMAFERSMSATSVLLREALPPAPMIKSQFKDLRQFWIVQFLILLKRETLLVWRDYREWITVMVQTAILAIFVGFSFFQVTNDQQGIQNRLGILSFTTLNQIYFYAFPLVPVFAMERVLIRKERYANMFNLSAFYLARIITIIPIVVVSSLILTCISYYLIGFQIYASNFFIYFGILNVIGFSAVSLGLFVGSVAPSVKTAIAIVDLTIIIFIIYSGGFLNLSTVTWVLRWIQYISIAFYGFSALAQNEFNGLTFQCDVQPCYSTGQEVLDAYNLDQFSIFVCCMIILGLSFAFLIGGYIGLLKTTKPKIRLT